MSQKLYTNQRASLKVKGSLRQVCEHLPCKLGEVRFFRRVSYLKGELNLFGYDLNEIILDGAKGRSKTFMTVHDFANRFE